MAQSELTEVQLMVSAEVEQLRMEKVRGERWVQKRAAELAQREATLRRWEPDAEKVEQLRAEVERLRASHVTLAKENAR
eukprot:gene34136-64308_t